MNGLPNVKTLANGLSYVVAPIAGMKSVTVLVLVHAGTRFESAETNGISHFLEHMAFKGTKKYPEASDLALAVDSVGGLFNAFTGKEYTGYYVKTGINSMDLALDIVSQLVFEPLISKDEMEIERGVILEEIRMYEDEPQSQVFHLFEEAMFAPQTISWRTLGKPEIIKSLSREQFLEYLHYLYTPNRMVVVVSGGVENLSDRDIEEKLNEYFGNNKHKTVFPTEKFNFKQKKARIKTIGKKTEQCHLMYGFRTFGREDKRRYILSVLATILGGGMSSRLFSEIREKRGLAYYVGTMIDSFYETGYMAMRAGTKPESAGEVLKLAKEEFSNISETLVTDKELAKAKEFLKGHLFLRLEDSYEVAEFFAEALLLEGKLRDVEEVVKRINEVSKEEVRDLAKELFTTNRESLAVVGPRNCVSSLKI
jgi:predicted Zn-dependent peptidase